MNIEDLLTSEGKTWRESRRPLPEPLDVGGAGAPPGPWHALSAPPGPWQAPSLSPTRRRRWVTLAAAAAVVAIAVGTVLIARPGSTSTAGRGQQPAPPVVSTAADSGHSLPGHASGPLAGTGKFSRSFSPNSGYLNSGPTAGPDALLDPGDDPHYARALAQLDGLIASIPLRDGAAESAGPSARVLSTPQTTPGSDELIARTRWWTSTKSPDQVLDDLAAWKDDGPATNRGGVSGVSVIYLNWAVPDLGPDQALADVTLLVAVIAVDGRTAVRLDVQADWVRTRPAASIIPAGVKSLEVTINRHQQTPVRRVLTGSDAQTMVQLLNGQAVAGSGIVYCLDMSGDDVTNPETDVIVATVPGGNITAVVNLHGCTGPFLSMSREGTSFPGLTGGPQVDAALLTMLGLPASG